jgi:hypothetical protein
MKTLIAATAALAVVIGGATASLATSSKVKSTPGHLMKSKSAIKGSPGASRYSPGHMMQRYGSRRGYPGASGYTPSRRSTTGVR